MGHQAARANTPWGLRLVVLMAIIHPADPQTSARLCVGILLAYSDGYIGAVRESNPSANCP